MNYHEKKANLFDVPKDYYLAHCISSDCNMGAGIATQFQKKFSLKNKLLSLPEKERNHPTCILNGTVFNLITKSRYYNRPTIESVKIALFQMKQQAEAQGITKIAMPKIASGRDRLSWPRVRELIQTIFSGTEIEILVFNL